jgi:hypothetical protein
MFIVNIINQIHQTPPRGPLVRVVEFGGGVSLNFIFYNNVIHSGF